MMMWCDVMWWHTLAIVYHRHQHHHHQRWENFASVRQLMTEAQPSPPKKKKKKNLAKIHALYILTSVYFGHVETYAITDRVCAPEIGSSSTTHPPTVIVFIRYRCCVTDQIKAHTRINPAYASWWQRLTNYFKQSLRARDLDKLYSTHINKSRASPCIYIVQPQSPSHTQVGWSQAWVSATSGL